MGYDKLVTLAERCAKYAQACGKRSILETKPIGKVDVSELGVCLSDGTVHFQNGVVRYRTVEEAAAKAKEIAMKEFLRPENEQVERLVAVEGRDILGIAEGNAASVAMPHGVPPAFKYPDKRTIDLYHNHPSYNESGDTFPISHAGGDLLSMLKNCVKSITAFNKAGEYSKVEVVNIKKFIEGGFGGNNKLLNDQFDALEKLVLGVSKAGRLEELRITMDKYKKLQQNIPSNIKKEYNEIMGEFCELMGNLEKNEPDKYAIMLHNLYQDTLAKYGLKYTTNFSNLLNRQV